jgi:hypothetical protein
MKVNVIDPSVFRYLKFKEGTFPITVWKLRSHPELRGERLDKYSYAIILGICEVLSGHYQTNTEPPESRDIDYPPDTKQYGFSRVDFDIESKTITVQSMCTFKYPVTYIDKI